MRDLHSRGEEHRELVHETNLKDCGLLNPECSLEEHRLRNIRKFDENLVRVECNGVPKLHCLPESCAFHPFSGRDGRT